jgi:anti-anti-sigma factor
MHTLVLIGELDGASAPTLEAAIEQLCETKTVQITFDLSKLSHIDGTGAAVLAFRCGWCERQGRAVALVPGPRPIQRVFERAGMADRLPFLPPHAGAPAPDLQATNAEPPCPVDDHAAGEPHLGHGAPPPLRTHSIAHLRSSSRRARARRARAAGSGA